MAKNTLWNLFGQGAPMLVAFLSIPAIIATLGNARFGTLTLAWVIVGYFSLFDLGLGRAVTQVVAARIRDSEKRNEIPDAIRTALVMMLGLGCLGSLVTACLTPWLASSVFQIPPELLEETQKSFFWLSLSVPALTVTAGIRGVLEALNRFDYANLLRVPMGLFNYLSPFLVFPFAVSLDRVVAVLVVGRFIFLFLHYYFSKKAQREEFKGNLPKSHFRGDLLRPLMVQGAWFTVSNIVGPVMVYFDRFILGAMVPVALLAYYTTPYEVITKMWVIPTAVMSSVFPVFAAERARARVNFGKAVGYIALGVSIPSAILFVFAPELLDLWLGPAFAANGTLVVRLLAVGIFVNSLAYVPIAFLQATLKPDWIAKLHLVELPFYLGGLWWAAQTWGVNGAAGAWLVRASLDAVALFYLARRAGL